MFSTTISKSITSVFLVALSTGATVDVNKSGSVALREAPVTLAKTSLMVATMADGEIQTQWMPRDVCERVEAAVAKGSTAAAVRSDGVSITIARANCSTPRVAPRSDAMVVGSSASGN